VLVGVGRRLQPAGLVERAAQVVVRLEGVRAELHGAPEGGDGLLEPPGVLQAQAQVVVVACDVASQGDRLAEAVNRGIPEIEPPVGLRQVGMKRGNRRIDRHGAADQGDRALRVARLIGQNTEQVQRVRMVGTGREDIAINRRRLRQAARAMQLDGSCDHVLHGHQDHYSTVTPS
jgi:hypothetical protein